MQRLLLMALAIVLTASPLAIAHTQCWSNGAGGMHCDGPHGSTQTLPHGAGGSKDLQHGSCDTTH